ncbi:MAG: hypothetical protein JXA74_13750 [Anaerolineae bacterium]|nr:hypothetical protein [Anaerolineae bacterium]
MNVILYIGILAELHLFVPGAPRQEALMLERFRHNRLRVLLVLAIALLLAVVSAPPPTAADPGIWAIRELSPLAYGRALALDVANRPHVAYAAWHSVHYAYEDAQGWHDETIVSQSWYDFGGATLALDAFERPHVAYSLWYPSAAHPDPDPPGTPRGSLAWAEWDGAAWQIADVDAAEGVRYDLGAIALAPNGTRHIVFTTVDAESTSSVWYGRQEGIDPWELTLLAQAGLGTWGAGAADLILDAADRPVLSYRGHDMDGPFIGVVTPDPAPLPNTAPRVAWDTLLRVDGDQAHRTALALGPDGALHLLYAAAVRQEQALVTTLEHYWQDGGGWEHEVVREGAFDADLAFDEAGELHAVWVVGDLDQGYGILTYAQRVGGDWQIEPVSANATGPYLALDGLGGPHIVHDVGAVLRYARRPEQPTTPTLTPRLWLPLVWR